MTRELLFLTSVESQLVSTTGWKSLDTTAGEFGPCLLAPSDFPGFILVPGQARYTTYDGAGRPLTGVQDVTLRVFFMHPQLDLAGARVMRSDMISTVEAFFSGGYTPPSVQPGDTASIDSAPLVSIDPGTVDKLQTRSVIAAHASYTFTLL